MIDVEKKELLSAQRRLVRPFSSEQNVLVVDEQRDSPP